MANTTNIKDVEIYLSGLSEENREALEKLRKVIKSVVPVAEECISYGMPAFRYYGLLVGYAAFTNHCSFFPMSPAVVEKFRHDLKGYELSKGTIRYTTEKMIPVNLIKKIVKARMAENETRKNIK